MKYWMLEFHERNGDFEYTHHHIYSDKNLQDLDFKGEDDEVIILSHFFGDDIDKSWEWGNGYWTSDGRVVSYMGMVEVKKSELKTLEKAHIYWEGEVTRKND